MRLRRGVSRQPGDGERARPVAGAQAHRHAAHRLDVHDARQMCDRGHGARRPRLHEGHRRILPHAHHELLVDQHVHDVDERQADERARRRRTRCRSPTSPIGPADVRGCAESSASPASMRTRRHGRSTRLRRYRAGGSGRIASAGGMRTARRTADCAPSAATARLTITDRTATPIGEVVVEGREPEELVVEADHARAEPGAGRDAGQRARSGDGQRPLDVVPGQLADSRSRAP